MLDSVFKKAVLQKMEDKVLQLLKGECVGSSEMEICQSVGIYLQMIDGLNEGIDASKPADIVKGGRPDVASAKNI